ncbi:MAG: hypothetical protein PHI97_23965, partial [Desulfobulbus sp.]|nr:hypothetical protein [Desulfobulbus sp.]
SRTCTDNTHGTKHDGHQHGSEQLEESFDPEMDDPETPVIDNDEIAVGSIEKCRDVEGVASEFGIYSTVSILKCY